MNTKHLYMWAFIAAIASISWYELKDCHRLPWPPRFIATALVFATLDVLSAFSEEITGIMAFGFVLALFLNQGFAKSGTGICKEFDSKATMQAQSMGQLTAATSGTPDSTAGNPGFTYGVVSNLGGPQSSHPIPPGQVE